MRPPFRAKLRCFCRYHLENTSHHHDRHLVPKGFAMRTFMGSGAHWRLLMLVALCATIPVFAHAVAAAEEPACDAASGMAADTHVQGSTAPESSASADGSAGSAGMRIYRDPATGEFTSPPPGVGMPRATRALGTSTEGLVETPGTSDAGGVTIDLRGRFQSALSATMDATGAITTRCHSDTPNGGTE
jgi:hypothetical protein